jgi:hypothetical protein
MSRKQFALVVWLCLPVVVALVLYTLIATGFASQSRARMARMFPPTGAGAGDTGGVNAVGELAAGNPATHGTLRPRPSEESVETPLVHPELLAQGFELVVEDATGLSNPNRPIYLASSINDWATADPRWVFRRAADGTWRLTIPPDSVPDPPLRFRLTLGQDGIVEATDQGTPRDREPPLLRRENIQPGIPPRVMIRVEKWTQVIPPAFSNDPE